MNKHNIHITNAWFDKRPKSIKFTLCGDSVNATARTAHEQKLPRDWSDDGLTCIISIGCAHQGAEHESGFIHIVGTSDI